MKKGFKLSEIPKFLTGEHKLRERKFRRHYVCSFIKLNRYMYGTRTIIIVHILEHIHTHTRSIQKT